MALLNTSDFTLKVENKKYRVRYWSKDVVVCDTDKLDGKFGDEYPLSDVLMKV